MYSVTFTTYLNSIDVTHFDNLNDALAYFGSLCANHIGITEIVFKSENKYDHTECKMTF